MDPTNAPGVANATTESANRDADDACGSSTAPTKLTIPRKFKRLQFQNLDDFVDSDGDDDPELRRRLKKREEREKRNARATRLRRKRARRFGRVIKGCHGCGSCALCDDLEATRCELIAATLGQSNDDDDEFEKKLALIKKRRTE